MPFFNFFHIDNLFVNTLFLSKFLPFFTCFFPFHCLISGSFHEKFHHLQTASPAVLLSIEIQFTVLFAFNASLRIIFIRTRLLSFFREKQKRTRQNYLPGSRFSISKCPISLSLVSCRSRSWIYCCYYSLHERYSNIEVWIFHNNV